MRTTPVAALGPWFVTLTVYVRFCPTKTGDGLGVIVTPRSVTGLTLVVTVAELLAEFESVSVAAALAVLVTEGVAAASGVTITVRVTVAPLATGPMLTVTTPFDCEAEPVLDEAETNAA